MSDLSGRTPSKLDIPITNNAFFPDLNLGELQEGYRTGAEYRTETIKRQTVLALIEVNRKLETRWCHWDRLGYETLEAVPQVELGEVFELVELYKTAVYARAKSRLMRVYPTLNRRDRKSNPGDDAEEAENSLLNESDDAIQLLLGDAEPTILRGSAI